MLLLPFCIEFLDPLWRQLFRRINFTGSSPPLFLLFFGGMDILLAQLVPPIFFLEFSNLLNGVHVTAVDLYLGVIIASEELGIFVAVRLAERIYGYAAVQARIILLNRSWRRRHATPLEHRTRWDGSQTSFTALVAEGIDHRLLIKVRSTQ